MKRKYKFYPQGITNFAGYMTEEEALKFLKTRNENQIKEIIGFEIIEEMTYKQAIDYIESLKC
jgi:hypothetical protein